MAKRPSSKRIATRRGGRMLRPKPVILSDRSLVAEGQRIKPPPNQFTHLLTRSQPYYFEMKRGAADGEFAAGTHVVLMVHDGGRRCRVVDAQGLYVETAYEGLQRL